MRFRSGALVVLSFGLLAGCGGYGGGGGSVYKGESDGSDPIAKEIQASGKIKPGSTSSSGQTDSEAASSSSGQSGTGAPP